jgi:hypothetical protein
MRAKEFISETTVGKLPAEHERPMQGSMLVRDVGGYDRIYYLNRLGMAMAAADGKNPGVIDGVNSSSWVEKYNSVHPYTPEESIMVDAAIATIPSESQTSVCTHTSTEPETTHRVSPINGFPGYKRR